MDNLVCVPPPHIAFVLRRLEENGYAAYVVGGCVRDAVMGRPAHDWDVTTSAAPKDVARLFPKTVPTGERFGTVTVVLSDDVVERYLFRTPGQSLYSNSVSVAMDGGAAANWRMDAALSGRNANVAAD